MISFSSHPDPMKHLVAIENGRLVSVTTQHIYPPIPYRGNDWCARYSTDDNEQPDYGWGATAEDAIQDLVDSYDYEEILPGFAELYLLDLLYARLHWQGIERQEASK